MMSTLKKFLGGATLNDQQPSLSPPKIDDKAEPADTRRQLGLQSQYEEVRARLLKSAHDLERTVKSRH